MNLSKIIGMLGFRYNPSKVVSIPKPYTDKRTVYLDHCIEVFETPRGFIVEALYEETIKTDNLVDVGFEILKGTNARGNNSVDCCFTSHDNLWLTIKYLRDVNF